MAAFEHSLGKIPKFQVLKLDGQLLLWIGSAPARLSELAVAVPISDHPSTKIMGQNDLSSDMAAKLSKKLNKQVFVSYNLPKSDLTEPQVLLRLMSEIKDNPEKFI